MKKKISYMAILFEEGHEPKYEKKDDGSLTITLDPSITTCFEALASIPDDLTVDLFNKYTLPAKIATEEAIRAKLGLPVTGSYSV